VQCQTDINLKKIFAIFLILLLILSCQVQPQREIAMGTVCVVNLFEYGNKNLYSRIFARLHEIDRTMGTFAGEFQDITDNFFVDPDNKDAAAIQSITNSLVSGVVEINRNAGIQPVKVRADLLEVLEKALYYA